MMQDVRNEILGKLKAAGTRRLPRPKRPVQKEDSWTREEMITNFLQNLAEHNVCVHQVGHYEDALDVLKRIARSEGFKKVMVAPDKVIGALPIGRWGRENHVEVLFPSDFEDRDAYTKVVFEEIDAGITGVDYAIAESGTLCLRHDHHQPRLISLAPTTHVALVPASSVVSVYEAAIEPIFATGSHIPSQVTFITGPSMTADIKATLIKGMHGPKKVIVIFITQA